MNADKNIVDLWLNKNGFFTISGIKVGNNREVDILAVQNNIGKEDEIWHVEIVSSVTSVDNIPIKDITERFNNKAVIKTVKDTMRKFVDKAKDYKKVLVIGKTSKIERYNFKDITVLRLSDILFYIFRDLDTHNYDNVPVRTMQLMKHLLIADPELLAKTLDKESSVLNLNTREQFLKHLMEQDETKRVLSKNSFEPELIKIIKNSTLNRPEKLAKALEEHVLNKRAKKKFIETLLSLRGMKQEIKQTMKDQKTLNFFAK